MGLVTQRGGDAMKYYMRDNPPSIPREIATCPICDSDIFIEEITEWYPDNGMVADASAKINCITEPPIDSHEWNNWMNWHWSMPYVDWLPVEYKVEKWLNAHYRIDPKDR